MDCNVIGGFNILDACGCCDSLKIFVDNSCHVEIFLYFKSMPFDGWLM